MMAGWVAWVGEWVGGYIYFFIKIFFLLWIRIGRGR